MKPEHEFLRNAVIMFAGSAALGAALLAGSEIFARRMEQAYQYHRGQLDASSQRYLAVDEEEKIIRDYLPRFRHLRQAGVLGREHRLNWIEVLQDAATRLQLPSLAYEISARQPAPPGMGSPAGSHRVYVSAMTLNMQLLHEGDLFALFDLLDEQAKGLYRVASCELTRNVTELADNPAAANLNAHCLLEWFSIRSADDPETNT